MTESTREQAIDNMTLACVIERVYEAGKVTTADVAESCTAGDEKDATRLLRKADARAYVVGNVDDGTMTWQPIESKAKRAEAVQFTIDARNAATEQGLIAAKVGEGDGNVVTVDRVGQGDDGSEASDAVEAAEAIVKAAKPKVAKAAKPKAEPKVAKPQPKADLVVGHIDEAFNVEFNGEKPAIDMIAHYTKSATRVYTCEAADVKADDGMKFVVVCMSHAVKGTQVASKPEGLKACRKPERFCTKCAALLA